MARASHTPVRDFRRRLTALRRHRHLTQQALSDLTGIHLTQIRRYEGGLTLPTFDILRRLCVALAVSGDQLLFEDGERDPKDELRFLFEEASNLEPDELAAFRVLTDGLRLRHHIRESQKRLEPFDAAPKKA